MDTNRGKLDSRVIRALASGPGLSAVEWVPDLAGLEGKKSGRECDGVLEPSPSPALKDACDYSSIQFRSRSVAIKECPSDVPSHGCQRRNYS